ncbi:MAG TPA: hypothetical protein VMZ90_00645 [Vicinamibacterales bacterium]|nr:hypothetical protein [Vicinamibacterales bacterium]
MRVSRLCLLVWLATATACSGTPEPEFPGGPFSVALVTDASTQKPVVRVTGWSSLELAKLRTGNRAPWEAIFQVSVPGSGPVAIAGDYRVTSDAVEMVPKFSLDPGREYLVTINAVSLRPPRTDPRFETRVRLPETTATPATRVTAIYPSSSTWPENILRFYLHFSSPMSGTSAIGHVRLVDERGVEVPDALLEVDVDLWNREYTRRTVFFDPGRVKRGIRPNVEMGRALTAGRTYAIVVDTSWRDAHGQPLAQAFRHAFTAAPAVEAPLDPAAWSITAPSQGTRNPVIVGFPWALDEGLLHRALGVGDNTGRPLDGEIAVGKDQTSWTFTPALPWRAVAHSLIVLTLLEDPSGNKVGQAFEFEMFKAPKAPEAERVTVPFRPR